VIHGDVMDIEPPERVDVIVSEWLGGFGIDEGMLVPVIVARDRWLKPGGVMIPRLVMAWAALVHDRYLAEMVQFLRDNPYGLRLDDLVEKTVNEIFYSGTFRHLAARDKRSEASRLWTTDTDLISLQQAQAPHQAETVLRVRDHGTAKRAGTVVQRPARARHLTVCGTWQSADTLGDDDGPAALACGTHARHVRPCQGEDRPGPAGRDLDELGHCAAGRRLGGARRAGDLGGDRRLRNLSSPEGSPGGASASSERSRGRPSPRSRAPTRSCPSCRAGPSLPGARARVGENALRDQHLADFEAHFAAAWGRSVRWLRVCLGDSPNGARYWAAKRLRCLKPQSVAAWLTALRRRDPSTSSRRTVLSAVARR